MMRYRHVTPTVAKDAVGLTDTDKPDRNENFFSIHVDFARRISVSCVQKDLPMRLQSNPFRALMRIVLVSSCVLPLIAQGGCAQIYLAHVIDEENRATNEKVARTAKAIEPAFVASEHTGYSAIGPGAVTVDMGSLKFLTAVVLVIPKTAYGRAIPRPTDANPDMKPGGISFVPLLFANGVLHKDFIPLTRTIKFTKSSERTASVRGLSQNEYSVLVFVQPEGKMAHNWAELPLSLSTGTPSRIMVDQLPLQPVRPAAR